MLVVINGIVYYLFECDDGETKALLIAPSEIRAQIFNQLHNARTGGHLGRDKTINSIKRRFYWPGLTSDVRRWCKACNECSMVKRGPGLGKFTLQQTSVGVPFDRIGIDIVGPCPVT